MLGRRIRGLENIETNLVICPNTIIMETWNKCLLGTCTYIKKGRGVLKDIRDPNRIKFKRININMKSDKLGLLEVVKSFKKTRELIDFYRHKTKL